MVKIGRTPRRRKQQHDKRCRLLFFGLLALFSVMAVLTLRSLPARRKILGSGAAVGVERMMSGVAGLRRSTPKKEIVPEVNNKVEKDGDDNTNKTDDNNDDGITSTTNDDGVTDDRDAADNNDKNESHKKNWSDRIFGGSKKEYPYSLNPVPASMNFASFRAKGGSRFEEYADGSSPYEISEYTISQSDEQARSRRVHVKAAMEFAWGGYTKYAFGADEVTPWSHRGKERWGNTGCTLVDSLDTLWLMDMKDEFWKARDWVRDHLQHDQAGLVSTFETTIRSLGGLLSAYDWSGDTAFLEKAKELGDRLLGAFPEGEDLPKAQVNLRNGSNKGSSWFHSELTAEVGTIQIENRYLSKMSKDSKYATKTEKVYELLNNVMPSNGLYPYGISERGGKIEFTNSKLTFGAMSDSFYEYMLKIWIQGGQTEPMYRDMYDKAIQGMHDILLQTSTPSGLSYIADSNSNRMDHKMDHLVCFMGGLLALGAYTDPQGLESNRAQRDLKTAKALTYTCYQMYARSKTGISPEWIQFQSGSDFRPGRQGSHYLLRPEAFESFFILSYLTKDPVYREWGWECFQAIERYCKTDIAYGALSDVDNVNGKPRDEMESFFLAESMKYLYLLQDPDTEVDILNKHVFNTEAHPTRIFPIIDQEGNENNNAAS